MLHRRLVRDYEHLPRSSESRVYWAMTAVILRRLTGATTSAWRAAREANSVDVSTLGEAIEAAASGWARVSWDIVGVEGDAKPNALGVTVRCLIGVDGSVPDDDDEPGMVAILSRAY